MTSKTEASPRALEMEAGEGAGGRGGGGPDGSFFSISGKRGDRLSSVKKNLVIVLGCFPFPDFFFFLLSFFSLPTTIVLDPWILVKSRTVALKESINQRERIRKEKEEKGGRLTDFDANWQGDAKSICHPQPIKKGG